MPSKTARLAFLYAALFYELGVNLPFFPIWLKAKALDDAAIGLFLAAPLLARIVANPVVTAFADRSGRARTTLVACAFAVALGTGILGVLDGFAGILAVVVLIALAQGPLIALTDSLTLRTLAGHPGAELLYGRIRLCGSLAFAAASLSAGWMLTLLPVSFVIVLLTASAFATALAATALPAGEGGPEAKAREPHRLSHPWLVGATICGAALVQASHAAVYAFSTIHWQEQGLGGATLGALWAVGIVSEVALFAFAGRYVVGLRGWLALLLAGGIIATLRWIGMATDPALPLVVLLQAAHGFSFGATHLGSIFLLARLSPLGMRTQVQGWLAAGWAGSMAVLTSVTGRLYPSWGEGVYLLMACAAGVGLGLLAIVALRTSRPAAIEPAQWRSKGPQDAKAKIGMTCSEVDFVLIPSRRAIATSLLQWTSDPRTTRTNPRRAPVEARRTADRLVRWRSGQATPSRSGDLSAPSGRRPVRSGGIGPPPGPAKRDRRARTSGDAHVGPDRRSRSRRRRP